jgi:hypothetical protein
MYLSVTPHVQPTHTGRTADDAKLPPHFTPNANYHVDQDFSIPLADLLARQQAAAADVLYKAQANLAAQREQSARLLAARGAGDNAAALAARNAMWEAVYALHKALYAFDACWNETAPRAAQDSD